MRKLHVLSLSFDDSLFDKESDVFKRHLFYSSLVKTYTVVIFTKSNKHYTHVKVGNLELYSTNSVSRFLFLTDTLKVVSQISKCIKFDLVTTQDPFITGLTGVILKYLYKIPLNIQIHSEFFNSKYFREESIQNFIFYFLGFAVLHFADTVRARNLRIRYDIQNRFPHLKDKTFYVGARISDVFLKPLLKKKRDMDLLVSCGRLCKQKNYSLMFLAFKKSLEYNPRLRLEIIGDGEYKEKLLSLRQQLGLDNKIFFLGKKTPKEIKSIFDTAGLFLFTSNHEGWGLVCLEAVSRGVPVIMTDTGCAGQIVINNRTGYVSQIGNVVDFGNKISQAYHNYDRSLKMSVLGRGNVLKDVDLNTIGRDMLKMYEQTKISL